MQTRFDGTCDINNVNEAVAIAKRSNPQVLTDEDKNPNILNVRNGLLNLETGELAPHTPTHWSVLQLPVDFDPEAKCPVISGYFKDVVEFERDVKLLEEVVGWTLDWWRYNPSKAVMLYGKGRNGKGAFLRLLTAFLGKENVSCVGLQKLVTDRFAGVDLVDKAANLAGDLPIRDLSDSDVFKESTGGDGFRVEGKGTKSFNYTNWAKMVFGANSLPKSSDDTDGFYSRWIIINFPHRFGPGGKKAIDYTLEERMHSDKELSGLLNLAVKGLQRLKKNKWEFSYSKTIDDVRDMYKRLADPVYAFVMDRCEVDLAGGCVTKAELHAAYKTYAKDKGLPQIPLKKFGKAIEDQTYLGILDGSRATETGTVRVWEGVKLIT
jgi:putative DNA primase/helicase